MKIFFDHISSLALMENRREAYANENRISGEKISRYMGTSSQTMCDILCFFYRKDMTAFMAIVPERRLSFVAVRG